MLATVFCIAVVLFSGASYGGKWSDWSGCIGSSCFKRRVLECTLDGDQEIGFQCAMVGETYFELLEGNCTENCTVWSEATEVSQCKGNCYDSKMEYQYTCLSQRECLKRQLRRCDVQSTCLGRWANTSLFPCSVTCGTGVRSVSQECRIASQDSYNCPGSKLLASRMTTLSCHNCNTWGNWSQMTDCRANCTFLRRRMCADNPFSLCANISAIQYHDDTCSLCPEGAGSAPQTFTDLVTYGFSGIGGFVILLVIVLILAYKCKTKPEPKCEENPQRVRITDIMDRFSPDVADSQARRSFGSHYESVHGNVYASPDELGIKRRKSQKQERKGLANRDIKSYSEYSLGNDVQNDSRKLSDSDSFEQTNSSETTSNGSPRVNEDVYATITDPDTQRNRKKSEKYARVKKIRKKKTVRDRKAAAPDTSTTDRMEDTSPYYESSFMGRSLESGIYDETMDGCSQNTTRSTTNRGVSVERKMPAKANTIPQNEGRVQVVKANQSDNVSRNRLITDPTSHVQNPHSPSEVCYTDMSGAGVEPNSSEYADMNQRKEPTDTRFPYQNEGARMSLYTDMNAQREKIPDAYSMEDVHE